MPHQGDHQDETTDGTEEPVMGLLHDHVPLTLLVDLADAPASEQLLVEEGMPDEPWWETGPGHPSPV